MQSYYWLLYVFCAVAVSMACFDPTICSGPTPVENPSYYYLRIQKIMHDIAYKGGGERFAQFVDKVKFKEYCASKGLKTFKAHAVYDYSPNPKIDWKSLPPSYVIKSNTGTAKNIFVFNNTIRKQAQFKYTADIKDAIADLEKILSTWKRWNNSYETWYNHIEPKILFEEYVSPVPDDIKVCLLNGEVDIIIIVSNNHMNVYDADMNRLPYLKKGYKNFEWKSSVVELLKSDKSKLNEAKAIAKRLAEDVKLSFVRIDLYLIDDVFYGGEITVAMTGGSYGIPHVDLELKRNGYPPHPLYGMYLRDLEKARLDPFFKVIDHWEPWMPVYI